MPISVYTELPRLKNCVPKKYHLAAAVFFFVITCLMLWPIVWSFRSVIPGNNGDTYSNMWPFWYLPYALTHGLSPWFSAYQMAPYGVDMIFHTNCYIPALITWPVNALLGIAAAYNSAILLAISLSGFGFYLLCQEYGTSIGGSLVGGVAFAFTAFTFAHLPGHPSLLQTQFVVFALLFLARTMRASSIQIWNSIGLGIAGWSVAVTDLTLLVTLLLLSVVVVMAAFVKLDIDWKVVGINTAIAGAVAVVLVIPWVYAFKSASANHDYSRVISDRGQEVRFYCSLGDLFLPPNFHGIWGRLLHPNSPPNSATYSETSGYLGLVSLALAACALWLRSSGTIWTWACSGILFVSFTLGLNYGNRIISIWSLILPENLNSGIPLLDQVRVPARFALAAHACIALLCAHGFDAITSKLKQTRRIAAASAGVGLILLDFFFVPIPVCTAVPSQSYQQAKLEGDGAVLELPLWMRSGPGPFIRPYTPKQLLDQTLHEKPLLSGYVSRMPKDVTSKVLADPVSQHINALQSGRTSRDEPTSAAVQAYIKRANVRWIVIPPGMPGRASLVRFLKKTVPLGDARRYDGTEFYEISRE